jgi:hypothetical protein
MSKKCIKYNCIEIRPKAFGEKAFRVEFDNSDQTLRYAGKGGKYEPCAMGFFHYPRDWEVEKAFDLLKQKMISDVNQSIECLLEMKRMLEAVDLPEWVQKSDKKSKLNQTQPSDILKHEERSVPQDQ